MSLSNRWSCLSELCAGVEALEVKHVSLNEVLFHLVEFVAADGVDVATLQLLFEDLGDRNLTQVGAHAKEVPVQHETVLLILHLGREVGLILLLGWELLRECRVIITVRFIAHVINGKLIYYNYQYFYINKSHYINSIMDGSNNPNHPPYQPPPYNGD